MNQKIMELKDVSRIYTVREKGFIFDKKNREDVLDKVSLSISPGEIIGLLGPSAAGKSVLARIMSFNEKPDSGQVLFKGEDFYKMGRKDQKKARSAVSFLPQDSHAYLNNEQTAHDYMLKMTNEQGAGDGNDTESKDEALRILTESFKLVNLSLNDETRKNGQLSGGQRQLLTLAKAFYQNPELVIADQPVNALDPPNRKYIIELFKNLAKEQGKAIVIITHNSEVISQCVDKIWLMDEGKLIEETETKEFFKNPKTEIGRSWLEIYNKSAFPVKWK